MAIARVLERAGLGSVRKGQLLPLHPAGSKTINEAVDLVENDEGGVVFLSGIASWCWDVNDQTSRRLAAVSLLEVGAATQLEVAAGFGIRDTTLRKWRDAWKQEGVNGLAPKQMGPHGASKLTPEVRAEINELRQGGMLVADIATRIGLSVRSVGAVVSTTAKQQHGANHANDPTTSLPDTALTPLAKPVSRDEERQAARFGEITEAPPVITQGASLPLAGTLIILPTLVATGLLDVFNTTYASTYATTRAAFYGLRSLVLSIVFCALLGCSRAEPAGRISPVDLGRLLGLDRGPETKTIRRRTEELAELERSDQLGVALANHHLESLGDDDGGVFYLDGHVRAYHGTCRLPKVHVARLERAMPGEEDAWLCDAKGAGVLVWSSLPGSGLTTELKRAMVEIRGLVRDDKRPTILFDRGGWSPKTFCEIVDAGFDLCTYRKAPLPREPRSTFVEMTFTDDLGRKQNYWLADRRVRIPFKEKTKAKYFSCRQITRLDPETGHQTQVLTTRYDDEPTVIAQLMFSRWRQENFFRYMRMHYDLDALDSYAKIPDDLERLVVNPKRKEADKKVKQAKALLAKAEQTEGRASLDGRRQKPVPVITSAFGDARKELERLQANAKALPTKIRLGDVYPDAQRTNVERKRIFDFIRMATYNAESALARLLEAHYSRAEDEARVLLREIFSRSADMVIEGNTLHVRIDSLSAPHRTRALAGLCKELTATKTIYPGTDFVMVYSAKDYSAG